MLDNRVARYSERGSAERFLFLACGGGDGMAQRLRAARLQPVGVPVQREEQAAQYRRDREERNGDHPYLRFPFRRFLRFPAPEGHAGKGFVAHNGRLLRA